MNLRTRSRLGGARRADEEQRLLGDGGHAHQVDDLLLVDEEPAERLAEAVDPLAQILGLGLEVGEGQVFGVGRVHNGGLGHVGFRGPGTVLSSEL